MQTVSPADNPARLILPADWRILSFGAALSVGVTFLFGLAPALRATRKEVEPGLVRDGEKRLHVHFGTMP